MISSEGPVRELTQEELVHSIGVDSLRAADALGRMTYEHSKLDEENALLSPGEAEILAQAEEIVKKIREAFREKGRATESVG